ncbi:MAG: sensor histidine kinase [Acidimicrobiia bacterium]
MSLRTRLLLALVALTAIGLAVSGLVTYQQLDHFLLSRVDQELTSASESPRLFFGGFSGGAPSSQLLPPGTWAQLRADNGTIEGTNPGVLADQAQPKVPASIPDGPFSVSDPHYRVLVGPEQHFFPIGDPDAAFSGRMIVAIPLRDSDDTLHRLLEIELLVAAVVLLALAMLAWWVVQLGLRPLEEMGATAGAIAAGDLSRRVEVADERTEVGRLGLALNSMLGQIEVAFAERTASETRLRRFVADAAHELRTPLTSIRGYAELFRRGASTRPDDLAKTMLRIEEGAARMGVLVDDLLLLARLDQGRPLERAPVDLTRLTAAAVDDLRVIAPGRPVVYESNGAVIVNGDEHRLRQVVANLLENARTHTPPTAPVEVRVAMAGDDALIEVQDHGPGMSPDEAARAFERFWRSDPSRARSSGGAGLGLAIVAAITQAHGGRAEVQTELGAGATFRVWIPRSGTATNTAADETADPDPDPDFELLPEVQAEP